MKTEQTAGPVRLSANAIIDGRWFAAGEPLPFAASGDVPEPLKPFIAVDEPAEPQGPPGMAFQPNRVYYTDAQGAIITPHGRREAARLAAAATWQAAAEEEALRQGELPEETRAALQAAHDTRIGLETKQLEIADRDRAAAIEQAQEAAAREAEPAKPPEFFVKRGAVFMHAGKAKLRPGEEVFTRQPNGQWWAAGIVDANGSLPEQEVRL